MNELPLLLQLLQSTEDLLVRVDQNLKTITSMNVGSDLREKLQKLVEKHTKANLALNAKKKALLEVLAPLALLVVTNGSPYKVSGYSYAIRSSGKTIGVWGNNVGSICRDYSLDEFVANPNFEFTGDRFLFLCEQIIQRVVHFITSENTRRQDEVQKISELIRRLVEIEK
ncbi:MAG: hypothetical protein WC673_02995 [Candidatus Paceibacterota bacterium]|jgi:hypothetical protein